MPRMTSADFHALSRAQQVLVTGGAGFIGSHLVEALLARELAVTVLDDFSTGRRANLARVDAHPALRIVRGDVRDADAVADALADATVIFHLAATVGVARVLDDPANAMESAFLGTRAVLAAATRRGATVHLASTSEVYGRGARLPFAEDDDRVLGSTQVPRWSYGVTKAAAEHLAFAHHRRGGVQAVAMRLFNTIGPRQRGRYGMVVPRLVGQALAGEPLTVYGDGAQRRCFCDVGDVVRALIALADVPAAAGRAINVGSDREISIAELAREIVQTVDADADPTAVHERLRFVPYAAVYGPDFEDPPCRRPSLTRLRGLTGWSPSVPLRESLANVVVDQRARRVVPSPTASEQTVS
ncbi:MAG: NAD-dependent epimerase/dehydratase family protein [Acidobacteriota bacterium]